MDLKEIMTISGYSGLFKVISQGKNSIIVESLTDGKRMPAFSTHKISSLDDIAIFAENEDIPLKQVLKNIFEKENGKKCPVTSEDHMVQRNYFLEVLPNYDQARVYASDIRKALNWYNQLLEHNLLVFEEEKTETVETDDKVDAKTKKTNVKSDKTNSVKQTRPEKKTAPKKEKSVQPKKTNSPIKNTSRKVGD